MSPEPLLFWQLDDIAPGNVVVDYGKGQLDGRLEGNPTVSPDDQFGAVVTLDGVGDAVVSPAPLPPYTTYTMCGWFRVPTQTSGMQTVMGRDLYGVHVNVLGRIMADLPGTNVRYSSGAGLFTYDTWHHLAVTRDTTLLRIHLDGVVVLEASVGAPPTVQSSFVVGRPPGNASQYQPMSVAAVRLYGTALSAAEVTELMAVDESPVTSFVRTHPLDFELANVDQQPVLYIDDAATSQTLTLRVTNSSRHDITLWPLSGAPSVTNRHFTLNLRPGTIAPASTVGLAASGWALAANEARTELYLRGPANAVVPAAASVELPLTGLRADGTDGTRVTRVELAYQRLGYTGETSEIVGTRQQSLEVVNHRGRPDIPLDVAFVGGNRVLSDGSGTSSLRLRVANVSRRVAIALAGSATVGKERASALVLSFDVQLANETRDWALTTAGQVGAVQVALTGATGVAWDVDKLIDDERAMWTLTPKQDTTIAAEEWLELGIGPVHGLTTPGHAPVVLSYRNVPGFQDGFVSVDVERSPLLFSGTNVAVGGVAAPFKLTVRAATEHLQLRREGQTGGNQIYLELYQSETSANVTTYPSIRFHHAGKFWHRIEGRPDGFMFKWGPPTSDDLSDIFARLGVFTSMRVDKVAVSGGEGHLRVERRDQAAGKQVFLELFQADVPANQGTFPSLRFHHANKFWHRIEGRPEGFLFKDGNTGSDDLRDIFARTASFTSLRLGSTGIGESDLRRLLDLARRFPF
ncbi:LamG domain-containing protein [Verrucosispora sp. SN26_14.1]|uniref:LamG domain-containing protein n=1 Tax=Verrucosispora sp. SN26_14.1 TaxID=2527879 RepID=UPI0010333D3C|nr:LamG domain-containing protein [Verrucosispora sp. SN26_14.1]TBL45586.1 LamG domain-containing protein [Verrucosispora sp. SN26_14.1]